MLFHNAKIFTSNTDQPYADSMLVQNGEIVWIGEKQDAPGNYTKETDLNGKRVLPGFVDSHIHPYFLARNLGQIVCAVPVTNSIEDIISHIKEKRRIQGKDKWIQGWGFDEGKLSEKRPPNRYDLDAACSDAPVVLTRACCHIIAVNSRALEIAGIDENTPDPINGKIYRDENNVPTGILSEDALELITCHVSEPDHEQTSKNIAIVGEKLLSQGITTITEMQARSGHDEYYSLYQMAREKGLKQRAALYYMIWDIDTSSSLDPKITDPSQKVFIGGLKILADGSVSGKTAWVDPGYINDEDNHGICTTSKQELLEAAEYAKRNQIQLIIHAMGESAIDLVSDTFYKEASWLHGKPSIRIEHAAMPTTFALKRCAESGIAFDVQPIFQYAEIESYIVNLGLERTKTTYPVQSMLSEGIRVAFSSDAPATAWADPSNPFVSLKAAVTRTSYDGTDCGQDQRVDIETAIRMYTAEGQYSTGIPQIGQLRAGFKADFIVLDRDLLSVPSDQIDEIQVESTYIEGEKVYQR